MTPLSLRRATSAALLAASLLGAACVAPDDTTASGDTTAYADLAATGNLALNQPAVASSTEVASTPARSAFDGSGTTRWSSRSADAEWIYVDLGASFLITGAKLTWEAAYARAYKLQVSTDAVTWTDVYSTTAGRGGTESLTNLGARPGRYVRLLGVQRATAFGYSLWEMEVYGTPDPASSCLLSVGRPATASSVESAAFPASAAVDGNAASRWSSKYADAQWLAVDLGEPHVITGVTLSWEAAYAKAYRIQSSMDNVSWTDLYSTTTGTGGTNALTGLKGTGRYVRMLGQTRATPYGYSLYELGVHGSCSQPPATLNTLQTIWDDMHLAPDGCVGWECSHWPGYELAMWNFPTNPDLDKYLTMWGFIGRTPNAGIDAHTRIEIRRAESYILTTANQWIRIQDTIDIGGGLFPESFNGSTPPPTDSRPGSQGGVSVKVPATRDANGVGYLYHFWNATQTRGVVPDPAAVKAVYTTFQARLVTDGSGIDDRHENWYVGSAGGDWYDNNTGVSPFPGITKNNGLCHAKGSMSCQVQKSRAKYITNQWQAFDSLGPITWAELTANPPPIH